MALVVSLSHAGSGTLQGDSKPSLSLALLPVWVSPFPWRGLDEAMCGAGRDRHGAASCRASLLVNL